jgi:hypothetical protein
MAPQNQLLFSYRFPALLIHSLDIGPFCTGGGLPGPWQSALLSLPVILLEDPVNAGSVARCRGEEG